MELKQNNVAGTLSEATYTTPSRRLGRLGKRMKRELKIGSRK